MASPQKENGYLTIANEIVEKIVATELNGSELRICLFVLRKTWSWHKKDDQISLTQIQQATGMSRKMVAETLNKLVTKRLLVRTKGSINTLGFNKNYDEWVVTNRSLGSYENVTRVVTKTELDLVTKTEHTKETIKETITKESNTNVLLATSSQKKTFGNEDINSVSEYFLKVFQIPKEDCPRRLSRIYWNHLLKESKTGVTGVMWLIDLAHKDEFYRNNITSSKDLYYKRIKLISRKRGDVPKIIRWEKGR